MNPMLQSLAIIRKRSKLHYFLIFIILSLLFINSFFAGQALYKTDEEKAEQLIEKIENNPKIKFISGLFKEKSYIFATISIFLNNFLIDVFLLYSGIIFVFTFLIPLSNIMLFGLIIGILSLVSSSFTIPRILLLIIVWFMEISAMILVINEGLRIGVSWISPRLIKKNKRKDALKQSILEGSKVLIVVALILIIAAIIETIGIAILGSKFIS